MIAQELIKHPVDPGAVIGGVRRLIEWWQGLQVEHPPRKNGVGVAHPGLDLGDRKLAWPCSNRRGWPRPRAATLRRRRQVVAGKLDERALPGAPFLAALAHFLCCQPERPRGKIQSGQPARRHCRRAFDPQGPRHKDRIGAERLGEIMRAQAGAALGLGQAEIGTHRPAHPWIGSRLGRPGPFVETAQNHHVIVLQPRLQRS